MCNIGLKDVSPTLTNWSKLSLSSAIFQISPDTLEQRWVIRKGCGSRFHTTRDFPVGERLRILQIQSPLLFSAPRFQKLLWKPHISKQAHFFFNVSQSLSFFSLPTTPPWIFTSSVSGYFLPGSLAWQNPHWFRGA